MRSLIESINRVLLNEVSLDNIALGYPNGFNTSHEPGHADIKTNTADILQHLNTADPTQGKTNEYTKWLAGQYSKQNIRQEDIGGRAKDALARIHDLKIRKKLPGFDINKHDMASVEDEVQKHAGEADKSKRQEEKQIKSTGAELIHHENGLTVHKITTPEAAHIYGMGTKWCTSSDKQKYAEQYLGYEQKDGKYVPPEDTSKIKPLYVVTDKNGKKFQMHFESNQWMNDQDKPVDKKKFLEDNPELMHVKEFQDKDPGFIEDKKVLNDKALSSNDKSFIGKAIETGKLSKDTMRSLADDPEHHYRLADQNIDEETQNKIISHSLKDKQSIGNLTLLSNNRNISGNNADRLLKIDPSKYSSALNSNNVHPDTLHTYANNQQNAWSNRILAASHPNMSAESIKHMYENHPSLHGAISKNPSLPSEILDELSGDSRAWIRNNVAQHKNTSVSKLHHLMMNDTNEETRNSAAAQLKKRKVK